MNGGEERIRTSGPVLPSQPLSRRLPSATRPPLRWTAGGGSRIRTHGALRLSGFQDRRLRPLGHPSARVSRARLPRCRRRCVRPIRAARTQRATRSAHATKRRGSIGRHTGEGQVKRAPQFARPAMSSRTRCARSLPGARASRRAQVARASAGRPSRHWISPRL